MADNWGDLTTSILYLSRNKSKLVKIDLSEKLNYFLKVIEVKVEDKFIVMENMRIKKTSTRVNKIP